MAGIMLKAIRSARPGDFISTGDLSGRITEMGLLHTEVQTEFRDLVTVPNLTMVTRPLKVVRASGTIVTTEVSLGYDLPQAMVREQLCVAAEASGLKDAFAHVRELGDFSVTYRVAGLLEDVQSLISARAALRASVLDTLHGAGIEIVSPTFMITRASSPDARVIPPEQHGTEAESADQRSAEEIAFDKADQAASIEEMRDAIARLEEQLGTGTDAPDEATRGRLEAARARLLEQIAAAEERKKNSD
jgi:small-conductance mechanosensitive channel